MRGQIISFVVLMGIFFPECQAKYYMEANKSVSFDCSSLSGDVEFFAGRHGKSELVPIKAEDEKNNLRLNNKILTFSQLYKEDLDTTFVCKNKEGANLTFNSHPQFVDNGNYRPKMSVISSSFRLLFEFDAQNAQCLWRFSRHAESNVNGTRDLEIKESTDKYVVRNNSLEILKPNSEDSGIYLCELKNNYGHNFRSIDVTVSNELMALLPFLAILAQVLLCSGLFFVWEKRCNKRDSSNEYSFEHAYNKGRQDPVA